MKARQKTVLLEDKLNALKTVIAACSNTDASLKDIIKLNDDISQATIPYVKKDEMRNVLKELKKILCDKDKAVKVAVSNAVIEEAKQLCIQKPDAKFFVHRFEAYNNTKAIDCALRQVKSSNPDVSALFVTVDADTKKIFCLASASKCAIDKGLKANEWIQELSTLMGGKGGGKADSAQGSGPNYQKVNEIIELANKIASAKLN